MTLSLCSYENLILKNELDSTFDKQPEKNQNLISKFFISIDFFTTDPIFLIKKESVFKTKIGGFICIILIIISVILFYVFGQDFFQQLNPKISYNEIKLNSLNDNNFFNSKEENIFDVPFMMGISKELSAATKLVYFKADNLTYIDADAHLCNLSEIQVFNVTNPSVDLDYFCLNYNKIIKNPKSANDIYLYPANCTELPQYKIDDSKCKNNPIVKFNSSITFEFYKLSKKFTIENISNMEYEITFIKNKILYDLNPKKFYIFYIQDRNKLNLLSVDKSYFFNSPEFSSSITSQPFIQTNAEPNTIKSKKRLGIFLIKTNPILLETKVVYQKFDQMLARVMSIISLMFLLCKIFYFYLSEYFLINYFKMDFFNYLPQVKSTKLIGNNKIFSNNSSLMNLKDLEQEAAVSPESKPNRLIKLFNFVNFFKSFFCVCSKKIKIYNKIYEEFCESLSSETFLKLSTKYSEKIEKPNLVIETTKDSFLKKIDILFKYENFFYIKNKKNFKTLFGGLISFLYFFLVVFIIVFFGNNYWTGKIISIQTNQKLFYEIEDKNDDLDIPFVLGFSKELQASTYFVGNYYFSEFNGTLYNICTDNDLIKFNSTFDGQKENMTFICSNLNRILENPYLTYQNLYIEFILQECPKKNAPSNCISKLNKSINYYTEFNYITDELNDKDFTLSKKIVKHKKRGYFNDLMTVSIFLQRYEIKDNVNKLFATSGKSKRFIYAVEDIFSKGTGVYIINNLDKYLNQTYKSLVYENFPEAMARIFAMLGIAEFVFSNLHYFIFKYFYYKHILLLLLNSSESSDIKKTLLENFPDLKQISDFEINWKYIIENNIFSFRLYIFSKLVIFFKSEIQKYLFLQKIIEEFISIENLYKKKLKLTNHSTIDNNYKLNNVQMIDLKNYDNTKNKKIKNNKNSMEIT